MAAWRGLRPAYEVLRWPPREAYKLPAEIRGLGVALLEQRERRLEAEERDRQLLTMEIGGRK